MGIRHYLTSCSIQVKTALVLVIISTLGIRIGGRFSICFNNIESLNDPLLSRRMIRATAYHQTTLPEIGLVPKNREPKIQNLSHFRNLFPKFRYFDNLVRGSRRRKKLSCPDSSSLNFRKDISDFVFTGTLQWIGRGVNKIQNIQGQGVLGGVLVKGVLKGPKYLEKRLLVIAGFGKDEFCISKSRVNTTRIFFVRLDEHRKMKLSSSLMKLNIKNLRLLTNSVAGKIILIEY